MSARVALKNILRNFVTVCTKHAFMLQSVKGSIEVTHILDICHVLTLRF